MEVASRGTIGREEGQIPEKDFLKVVRSKNLPVNTYNASLAGVASLVTYSYLSAGNGVDLPTKDDSARSTTDETVTVVLDWVPNAVVVTVTTKSFAADRDVVIAVVSISKPLLASIY